MNPLNTSQEQESQLLSCDEVLKIARQDAEPAYGDLAHYRITLRCQADGWHVDYDLTEPYMAGGGPHYLIDATTGVILWKRYDQ
jgi:hypothetical protein